MEYSLNQTGLVLINDGKGQAQASSEYPHESAANAFDGNLATKWYNTGTEGTAWITYTCKNPQDCLLLQYSITSANDVPERDPYSWMLYGCSYGSRSWQYLHSIHASSFTKRHQTIMYSIQWTNAPPNRSSFYKYKFVFKNKEYHETNTSNFGVQVACINLYQFNPNQEPESLPVAQPVIETIAPRVEIALSVTPETDLEFYKNKVSYLLQETIDLNKKIGKLMEDYKREIDTNASNMMQKDAEIVALKNKLKAITNIIQD